MLPRRERTAQQAKEKILDTTEESQDDSEGYLKSLTDMFLDEVGAMEVTIMKKCKEAKDKGQEGQKRKLGKVQQLHVTKMIDVMSAFKNVKRVTE